MKRFDLFLDSRAEMFALFFLENLRHQKDILKLTDLYPVTILKSLTYDGDDASDLHCQNPRLLLQRLPRLKAPLQPDMISRLKILLQSGTAWRT